MCVVARAVFGLTREAAFLDVLYSSVRAGLARGVDAGLETQAVAVREGWVHVNDERNEAAKTGDRIGSPDDIVGSVYVKEGKVRVNDTLSRCTSCYLLRH